MEIQTLHPRYITDANGAKIEVILPIEEYYELLEDLEDLAAIAQRKDEETIPFEKAIKDLGLEGHV